MVGHVTCSNSSNQNLKDFLNEKVNSISIRNVDNDGLCCVTLTVCKIILMA